MKYYDLICIALSLILISNASNINGQICQNSFGAPNQGECMQINSCTGAALIGNCNRRAGFVCCVPETSASPVSTDSLLTMDIFLSMTGNTIRNRALYPYFVDAFQKISNTNNNRHFRVAAFYAQLVDESRTFRFLESDKADADRDVQLGNSMLNDGSMYRGRGAIHIRGKANYALANKHLQKLDINVDLLRNPERAAFPSLAFTLAAWFWNENAYVIDSKNKSTKASLNSLVDGTFMKFSLLTHALTNRYERLRARAILNENVLRSISYSSLKRGEGEACKIGSEIGYAVPMCTKEFKRSYCGCEGLYSTWPCPYGTSGGACRNPTIVACCVEKCKSFLDLVILLDSSGSIHDANFQKEKEFVKNLLSNLEISVNETKISIINYSDQPELIVSFKENQNKETIMRLIDGMRYLDSGTDTASALNLANDAVLVEANGMRPIAKGIPKIVIVITDGESNHNQGTIDASNRLKRRGFNVISIGVGSSINQQELKDMASSAADVYNVADFDRISSILNSLARSACQQPAQVEAETEVKSVVDKNAYKYFMLQLLQRKSPGKNNASSRLVRSVTNDESVYMQNFTIQLNTSRGETYLYYSFTDENPKADEDFIDHSSLKADKDFQFIENGTQVRKRRDIDDTTASVSYACSGTCQINRPLSGQNEVLYFSVKGKQDINEFQVYVYNRTINGCVKTGNFNQFFTLVCLFFVLIIYSNIQDILY